jgi:putative transposase
MPKRYELTEAQWKKIEDLLPGKVGDRGRTARDNRTFVNGCLWVLRSGAYYFESFLYLAASLLWI